MRTARISVHTHRSHHLSLSRSLWPSLPQSERLHRKAVRCGATAKRWLRYRSLSRSLWPSLPQSERLHRKAVRCGATAKRWLHRTAKRAVVTGAKRWCGCSGYRCIGSRSKAMGGCDNRVALSGLACSGCDPVRASVTREAIACRYASGFARCECVRARRSVPPSLCIGNRKRA